MGRNSANLRRSPLNGVMARRKRDLAAGADTTLPDAIVTAISLLVRFPA
jgi:hypothetical protein